MTVDLLLCSSLFNCITGKSPAVAGLFYGLLVYRPVFGGDLLLLHRQARDGYRPLGVSSSTGAAGVQTAMTGSPETVRLIHSESKC